MISGIVGRYLLKRELLTPKQLEIVLLEQGQVRVKLGLIAVAEGLMTQEETEKVHRFQTVTDKRHCQNGNSRDPQLRSQS